MIDTNKVEQEKSKQYFLAINSFFPTALSLETERAKKLIPWLVSKFKITEEQSIKIYDSWKVKYIFEGLAIDNYSDFIDYAQKYEQAILSKGSTFTKESFGKLCNYILEAKDEYDQSKRWFCLAYMSEKYSTNLFESEKK